MSCGLARNFKHISSSGTLSLRFLRCLAVSSVNNFQTNVQSLNNQKYFLKPVFQNQMRYVASKVVQDKKVLHIKECFSNDELKYFRNHPDLEVRKLCTAILDQRNAQITADAAETLKLRYRFDHGRPTVCTEKVLEKLRNKEQPEIYHSLKKGNFSKTGSESESAKISKAFDDIKAKANVKDTETVLLGLLNHMKSDPLPCSLIGLYCSKDLPTLRFPLSVFYHIVINSTSTQLLNLRKLAEYHSMERSKASKHNERYSVGEDEEILKFALESLPEIPKGVQAFNEAVKGFSFMELTKKLEKTPASLRQRFRFYIKPTIQSHMTGKNLPDIVAQLNQYIVDEKIPSKDQIDYGKFAPFEKNFLHSNININDQDRSRKEPLWIIVKDRIEKGKFLNNFLQGDRRTVLINTYEKFQNSKGK